MTGISIVIFAIVASTSFLIAARSITAFRSEFLSVVVFSGYGLVYGVAPMFLFWSGAVGLEIASIASLFGLAGLIAGRMIARTTVGKAEPLNPEILMGRHRRALVLGSLALGTVGVFLFAYGTAGSLTGFVQSSRFEYRLNAFNPAAKTAGSYLMSFLGVPAALLIAGRPAPQRYLALSGGFFLAISLFAFTKGARSTATGMILTLAVVWLAYGLEEGRKHRGDGSRTRTDTGRLRVAAGVAAFGLGVSILLPNLYEARKYLGEGFSTPMDVATLSQNSKTEESFFERDPLNYSTVLVEVTSLFPQSHDFLWAYPLRRVLFFPFGSGGIKPDDTNKVVAVALGRGRNETTIPPSLPGEGYVSFGGVFGVFPWVALYGYLLGLAEARLSRPTVTVAVLAVGLASCLLGLRGQMYELAMTVLIVTTLSAGLVKFTRAWKSQRTSSDMS